MDLVCEIYISFHEPNKGTHTLVTDITSLFLSYFIQKGADVNAAGGELMGTPLHWATR